jgi:heme/copper-type cytochrome/quinol oxidase subunit 2
MMASFRYTSRGFALVALMTIGLLPLSGHVSAQQAASASTAVKSGHFVPAEIHAPANRPLTISVKNLDAAAIEFDSVSLRVEKIIAPGAQGAVRVRPLAPGRYEFFDDFHQQTRGTLVVE